MIRSAQPAEMDLVRELFREYAASLGADWVNAHPCLASFERELETLPGGYSTIMIAFDAGQPAGCVALRKIGDGIGEMKRLYVRPSFQGRRLGRLLVERIVMEARAAGFQLLRLDTLRTLERAIGLYRRTGFREIAAYSDNPPEAICFELAL